MKMARGLIFLALGLVPLLRAEPASPEGIAYFETQVRPALIEHCYECHSEEAGERKGGLLLDRQSGWLDGGELGQAVVPGDVEGSIFIEAIRYGNEDLQMPPKHQLDPDLVAVFEKWIAMGAPGPKEDLGETGFSALGDQEAIFKNAADHWAFQAVRRAEPPAVDDPEWNQHPVDRYIFAKLGEKGLAPSPAARPRVLQRRLAYDLTGLPPGPRTPIQPDLQIEAHLDSPAFGEHFARLWLDVARYADTANVTVPTTKMETYYPYAYTYRDYVIRSFNADKPYDRFIKEQLAADLLGISGRDPDQAALGFIAVTPFLTNPHDFADDVIDTTMRGFMGLTVACARCHDHKFEPIPTADYYALHGVFSSIEKPSPEDFEAFPEIDGYPLIEADQSSFAESRAAIEVKIAEARKSGRRVGANRKLDEVIQQSEMAQLVTYHDGAPSRAIVVKEKKRPIDSKIFLRGEPDTRGDVVPRRFLRRLDPAGTPFPDDNSGRLALAERIASPDNPLTARVFVNRVWGRLMGAYLVDTPSDFGLQGAKPSHPELLDWLAADFMDHGWSVKHLVRTIVTSRTYQQASLVDAEKTNLDPTNLWYHRAHSKRLGIEQLRDSLLALSGTLDDTLLGHPKDLWDVGTNRRRSIYGLINRINNDPTLRAFDFPSPTASADRRTENIAPQQSLFALNSPFVATLAQDLVTRLSLSESMTPEDKVNALYQRIYRRDASPAEQGRIASFRALMEKRNTDPLPLLAQSLLISNEFLYLD